MMVRTIAFLGIGLMGAPMARRLAEAGHHVTAWNRTRAKADALATGGITVARSAAEAAQGVDVIVSILSDGNAVAEIAREIVEAGTAKAGAIWVDMSSTRPDEARGVAGQLATIGLSFVDAPVSGGTKGAEAGTLAIMAGGEASDVAAVTPVLSALGRVVHVGPTGSGQVAKLCNQMIVGITIGAVAEALHLAGKAGADPAAVRAAIRGGFAESRILELHGARMIERNFVPGGTCATQLKDMRNIMALAGEVGAAAPLSDQIGERYRRLVEELGQGALDHSALLVELENR